MPPSDAGSGYLDDWLGESVYSGSVQFNGLWTTDYSSYGIGVGFTLIANDCAADSTASTVCNCHGTRNLD